MRPFPLTLSIEQYLIAYLINPFLPVVAKQDSTMEIIVGEMYVTTHLTHLLQKKSKHALDLEIFLKV